MWSRDPPSVFSYFNDVQKFPNNAGHFNRVLSHFDHFYFFSLCFIVEQRKKKHKREKKNKTQGLDILSI